MIPGQALGADRRVEKMSGSKESCSILVWRTLKDVWKIWYRQAEKNLSRIGLNNMEYTVLRVLSENGSLSMVQLANLTNVTQGWITSIVDKLEEKKLAERMRGSDDRRIIMIQITRAGNKLLARARDIHSKFVEESVKALEKNEISDLLAILEKMKLSLSEESAEQVA